jgi:hypothetical protein
VTSLYSLVFVFECKRILCSNAFILQSVTRRMSVIDLCTFLVQVFHLLTLYYDPLFGVYQDLTLSCMPGLVSELTRCCSEFFSI